MKLQNLRKIIDKATKLGIKTIGELAEYKTRNNITSNQELYQCLMSE